MTIPLPGRRRGRIAAACAAVAVVIAVGATCVPAAYAAEPLVYEAEDAALAGGAGVNQNHLGYSGSGFVDGFVIDHTGTAAVTFDVDVPAPGEYGLNLRYANGLGSDMTLSQVIGDEDRQIVLPSAIGASWSQWFIHQEAVTLDAGPQRIAFRFDAEDTGNVNLDAIALTAVGDLSTPGGGATDPGDIPGTGPDTRWDAVTTVLPTAAPARGGVVAEAEDAFRANGAVVTQAGPSGVDLSAERARLVVTTFAADSRAQAVSLRYRSTATESVRLVVGTDGMPRGVLELPPSSAWRDIAFATPLREGLGTVELRRVGDALDGGVVVDALRLERGTDAAGRGAHLGTTVYEAEHGRTDGVILTESRTFHDLAAEASGRQAVTLAGARDEVAWTLTAAAGALEARVSIPDTAEGTGQDGMLAVYAGSKKIANLPVTSRHSWVYGAYPYGNDPSQGGPQRYFDDGRITFPQVPAGTKLRLVNESGDLPYTVDLIETGPAPVALPKPDGYLDVRDFGATADDGTDDTAAIVAAVAAAQEQPTGVWIPQGRFTITDRVRLVGVSVRGAGPWYSVLQGREGRGGLYAMGSGVTVADLMIDGDADHRDDARSDSGLEGDFGQGSLVQDVWIAHTKTGVWVDAGTDGLLAVGLRVRDTYADGIHLHGGVTDAVVAHASVRNTGDDAMAMWSSGGAVTRAVFTHATVQSPLLGNGAAIYGGDSNRVTDSVIADTLTAPAGIAVSTRFNPVPFSGTTVVSGNDIFRSGGWEPNWSTSFGGIWVFADTSHITTPVVISDTRIVDSSYEGLLVSGSHWVNDLRVSDVTIEGTGSYAVAARVGGDHRFRDVVVSGVTEPADGRNHLWGTFIDEGGNTGLLAAVTAACAVTVKTTPSPSGAFVATVTLRNTGAVVLPVSSLAWHAASGEAVLSVAGAEVVQTGTRVEVHPQVSELRPGGSRTLVVSGTVNGPRLVTPAGFTLDGVACGG
ncbi:cellulose binding domain-containing protein [Microbacterium sp. NEAU-LLC]|uniref:Cellulose binding domain-containing protein n=1 Tax=Microbacterium helvum TaxID=2773713 RepID=A0ABR8NUW7_9MICO|nr:glycosyl hydrolase family 28-related protein [Microbacterium helvum]MBD3943537.1 cellulose binding domain-containing protein [Microbacterium helvum]